MQVFIFILLAVRIVAADDPLPGTIFNPVPKAKQGDFDPPKAPLRPTDFPNWQDPVNRDRVFDFYAKEAIAYLDGKLPSGILPAYLGLDGGQQGHWGNQNDDVTWKDNRWGASDHGHLFSGVFNDAGQFVAKGVWVREGELNGCFDPSSLRFRVKWKGEFLKLSARRHGFNTAAEINGEPFTSEPARKLSTGDVYHGFYRQGEKVIFSYTLGGKEYTETLSGGRKERDSVQLARGGATRWPGWIETSGKIGTGDEFAADTLVLPTSNPYGTLFFVSGFDFFPDGSIALCTMTGEVWLVRGIDTTLTKLRWKRFATGLHQPLGLKVINGDILVMGRDQVTRLVDLNGDNEADFYECLTNAHTTSYGSHDYIVGLDTDPSGRLLTASANQGILRMTPPRGIEVLGTGLRNPNGIAVSPDGRFIISQGQEGNWTPASALSQIDTTEKGPPPYFGHPGPQAGRTTTPPLLNLPRGVDNSSGGGIFLSERSWPELRGNGNLIHLSYGAGCAFLVTREQVDGVWQGAATLITGAFESGPQHARFNPHDGQLYVSGMTGWGTYTPADGSLQRVRRVGLVPLPIAHEVRADGILLHFDQPLDANIVADARKHFAQAWNYRYGPSYGSPEFSIRQPNVIGHDDWPVKSTKVMNEGRSIFLEIPSITFANQVHLHVAIGKNRFRDIFLTVNALGKPYLNTSTTTAIHSAHPKTVTPVDMQTASVKWESELCGLPFRTINLRAATGLQYEQRELRAVAGEYLALVFDNPDDMPHNWVLTEIGAADAVAKLADLMVAQPDGFARHYVPDSTDILCYSRLVLPRTRTTLYFNAPTKPGRYPYLCTFPGHAQIMRGVLVVEPAGSR